MRLVIRTEEDFKRKGVEIKDLIYRGLKGGPVVLEFGREKRTQDQNAKLWPMLRDISNQVEFMFDHHSPEVWKDLLTAAWRKQKIVPGLDGGLVALGVSTSKLPKEDLSELIESIYAYGAEQGVQWSEPALKAYEENCNVGG